MSLVAGAIAAVPGTKIISAASFSLMIYCESVPSAVGTIGLLCAETELAVFIVAIREEAKKRSDWRRLKGENLSAHVFSILEGSLRHPSSIDKASRTLLKNLEIESSLGSLTLVLKAAL